MLTADDFEDETDCVAQMVEDGMDADEAVMLCADIFARRRRDRPEIRSAALEIRAKGQRLEGYAATFNTEARIADFTETIAPGAFSASLGGDVVALVDHDVGRVLARTKSKTLRLAEDSKGLAFDLDVPPTTFGNDVLALAERGDLGGMSFGFRVAKDGETWAGSKRTLRSVDLAEISVVSAWPAYEGTVVNARAKGAGAAHVRLALARRYLETLR
jgi:HK97 family phage prohead protease